ncbi:hypothetical protein EYC84_001572 [Monilinia fructicola]|uniref:Uncharacterized protein n=1 Tax=Monilinia fructicola TaxID=38448 RepID=A0A5M9JQ00_MONFR|nr:hypothetical protein EYC84_001572 [Monilinia fructicola]
MSTIPEMFLSQVHNTREVDTPDQFPDVEAAQFNSSPSRSLSPGRRRALGFIIVIESFLAMVNILSGMMASEGKGWGLMFVCVFLLWLILLLVGLVLYTGMKSLEMVDITKYVHHGH